jgi:hypothetical protein
MKMTKGSIEGWIEGVIELSTEERTEGHREGKVILTRVGERLRNQK